MKIITQLWSSYFSLLCNYILHITSTEKFWNVLFFSVDIWEETDNISIIPSVWMFEEELDNILDDFVL